MRTNTCIKKPQYEQRCINWTAKSFYVLIGHDKLKKKKKKLRFKDNY